MRTVLLVLLTCVVATLPSRSHAQTPRDTLGVVRFTVRHDSTPVANAYVRSDRAVAVTSSAGQALLRVAPGARAFIIGRIGFKPETLTVNVIAGETLSRDVVLESIAADLEAIVISSTRTNRRVEAEPTRVEVLAIDEIEEKLMMTPGDIAMMLNETGGLRVQTTSPSLGGANVRVQGLRGRYTQLLSDGLPLYGGQAGGLGLLQIPPMDLRQVEVIKGAATALYGSSALGGVINLISRLPASETEREVMLNQTTRGGTDGILWLSGPVSGAWGYTMLGGVHRQSRTDIDDDGWTDMPGYTRVLARPRLFWNSPAGHSLFVTGGFTTETRQGGTVDGRTAPDGAPYAESLDTRRADIGVVTRWLLSGATMVNVRASAMTQRHDHQFGAIAEHDRHGTAFAEVALSHARDRSAWLLGAAFQNDRYTADELPAFDYSYSIPSVFAQADFELTPRLSLTASARADAHSEFGTLVNPRVAALVRGPREWTARLSIGSGTFAPSPFTEETEVFGLSQIQPLAGVREERAVTGAIDVGGALGPLEVNVTAFGSRVRDPLTLVDVGSSPGLRLVNSDEPTRTSGGELFVRYEPEPFVVTGTYTFVRSREFDLAAAAERDVPLTPRHAVGVVGMWEEEDKGRVGFEFYYTGRQGLGDNPYRTESKPYVIIGALAEWHVGNARVFVNAENLSNVRQTRYDPLLRPAPGRGGRWTTDTWTELSGRTVNGGVRLRF